MRGKHSRKKSRWGRSLGSAIVIVVLVGAGTGYWWRSSHPKHTSAAAVTTSTTQPRTAATYNQIATSTLPPTTTSVPRATTAVAPPTTSLVAPPIKAPGSFSYTVAAGTRVTITARNRCWIQARPNVNGRVLADVILRAGQTMSFASPVWLRLGDPTNVRVTAGTAALSLPVLSGDVSIISP